MSYNKKSFGQEVAEEAGKAIVRAGAGAAVLGILGFLVGGPVGGAAAAKIGAGAGAMGGGDSNKDSSIFADLVS